MPIFQYSAYDAAGKSASGTIEASSAKEAREKLRKDGLFPRELSFNETAKRSIFAKGSSRVPVSALAATTRQLSTLLSSGTPLFEALSLLAAEEENKNLSKTLFGVKEKISGGASLSKALEAYPKIFEEFYVRGVEAGEAGGTLDNVLQRLAEYLEARSKAIDKVKTALIYPALMVLVGAAVLFFLFIFVIPKITVIFEDTQQSLPLITIALLFIVNVLKNYWYFLIICIAAAVFGLRSYIKTPKGKENLDILLLKIPVIGRMALKFYMANFARTLGSLLKSGVPMLGALEMTRKVLGNSVISKAVKSAATDVTEGAPLSKGLKSTGAFPAILTHLIATGERSGNLGDLLLKAADTYESEFESSMERSLTLLEPMLIIAMGVAVGFIILAILLPIFELNQIIK